MLKRSAAAVLLLGLFTSALIAASGASGYLYKKPTGNDCGRATVVGGFGGPLPSNVPADARPQIDTFIDRGSISCANAKHVMSSFEKSFAQPGAAGKGVSPKGWKCKFNTALKGQACTSVKHVVISNGIIYVVPKAG